MKNTWVLSIKTSLPGTCSNAGELKTKMFAFDNFEEAKSALRKVLKKYAFSENSMFDGNGNIIYFNKHAEDGLEDEEAYSDDFLTRGKLTHIHESIKRIFAGEDFILYFIESCDDGLIACTYKNGVLNIFGFDDGPINGYDPTVKTNMFSMKEQKNYYLYIDDAFGQYEEASKLYIDLIHAEEFCNE